MAKKRKNRYLNKKVSDKHRKTKTILQQKVANERKKLQTEEIKNCQYCFDLGKDTKQLLTSVYAKN